MNERIFSFLPDCTVLLVSLFLITSCTTKDKGGVIKNVPDEMNYATQVNKVTTKIEIYTPDIEREKTLEQPTANFTFSVSKTATTGKGTSMVAVRKLREE